MTRPAATWKSFRDLRDRLQRGQSLPYSGVFFELPLAPIIDNRRQTQYRFDELQTTLAASPGIVSGVVSAGSIFAATPACLHAQQHLVTGRTAMSKRSTISPPEHQTNCFEMAAGVDEKSVSLAAVVRPKQLVKRPQN